MQKNENNNYQRIEILVPDNDYESIPAAFDIINKLIALDIKKLEKCDDRASLVNVMTEIKLDLGKFYGVCSQLMREKLKELEHTS